MGPSTTAFLHLTWSKWVTRFTLEIKYLAIAISFIHIRYVCFWVAVCCCCCWGGVCTAFVSRPKSHGGARVLVAINDQTTGVCGVCLFGCWADWKSLASSASEMSTAEKCLHPVPNVCVRSGGVRQSVSSGKETHQSRQRWILFCMMLANGIIPCRASSTRRQTHRMHGIKRLLIISSH